jgi:hypothetical protein
VAGSCVSVEADSMFFVLVAVVVAAVGKFLWICKESFAGALFGTCVSCVRVWLV